MFKRHKRNPFEKEMGTALYEPEANAGTATQGRAEQFNERSTMQGYKVATPPKEDYSSEAPPRIFDEREPNPNGMFSHPPAPEVPEEPPEEKITHLSTGSNPHPLEVEEPETTLGEGVFFKGELAFKRLLRIDGHFEGTLNSEGKLMVGPKGIVKSDVKLQEAIVEGFMEGDIEATRIELRGESAQIHGNIKARFLSVDEGSTIVGQVNVTPSEAIIQSET